MSRQEYDFIPDDMRVLSMYGRKNCCISQRNMIRKWGLGTSGWRKAQLIGSRQHVTKCLLHKGGGENCQIKLRIITFPMSNFIEESVFRMTATCWCSHYLLPSVAYSTNLLADILKCSFLLCELSSDLRRYFYTHRVWMAWFKMLWGWSLLNESCRRNKQSIRHNIQ